jgi:hypothetical protein
MNPHELISQSQAAREYRLGEHEIKAARESGLIPYRAHGKAYQMRRCDIEAYIASSVRARILAPAPAPKTTETASDDDWMRRSIREAIPNYRPS